MDDFIPDFDKPIVFYSLEDLRKAIFFGGLLFIICQMMVNVISHYLLPRDNNFDGDTWYKSGVTVIIDHKTGIEYLKTETGFLMPRMEKTK